MQSITFRKRTFAHRRQIRWAHRKRWLGLWLISPWLIGLVLFKLVPILASLGFSFTNFHLLPSSDNRFVGLANYAQYLTDRNTGIALWQTVRLALIGIPLQLAASIFVAALLSSPRLRMRNAMRALFFLPSIIPSAAALAMWQGFTDPGSGWLNALLLDPLGLDGVIRLSSGGPNSSLSILSTLWTIGPGILILMGAMQGIPVEVQEAARVDGAGRLRSFFSITLPMITPAIFFTLVLSLTAVFGGAILLDRGRSFNSNLSSYDQFVYFVLFNLFRLGGASSLAWLFFAFVMGLMVLLFWTARSWVYFPEQEA
jgi:ABC-type sugar transport system permease subunit